MKTSLWAVLAGLCIVIVVSFYNGTEKVQAQSVPSSLQKELSDEYWTMWRAAFQTYEQGEDAIHKRDYEAALLLFQSALDKFTAIKKNNPEWNKSAVDYRIALAKRKVKTTSNYLQVQDRNKKSNSNNDGVDLSEDSVKIQTLRQRLLEAEERITQLASEVERARLASAQVNRLMAEKIQIEKDYNALQVQYQELKKNPLGNFELPDAVKQQLAEMEEKLQHLQKQLDTAAERNAVLAEKNQALLTENTGIADELKTLKQRLEVLQKSQEKMVAENQSFQDLQQKLEAAEKENANLQKTLNDHLQKIKSLEKNAETSAADQQRQLEKMNALNESVKQMESLKKQLAQMQQQLAAAAEKEKQAQAYIKTLDSQNKVFQRTVEDLSVQLEKLNAAASGTVKQEEPQQLKNELEQLKKSYEEKLEKQRKDLIELKSKLDETEKLLENVKKTSNVVNGDLSEKLKAMEDEKKVHEQKK